MWPELPWRRAVLSTGAFHRVIVFEGVAALRVSTAPDHRERSRIEKELLARIAHVDLPFLIPRSLAQIRSAPTWSGHLVSYTPGAHREQVAWNDVRSALADALAAVHSAALPAGPPLPEPRPWCGAAQWPAVVERITRSFDRPARTAVGKVIQEVEESEAGAPKTLVHGDFGLHNTLWEGEEISGIIDLDHLATGDPGIDFAPLIGQFGVEAVAQICDPDTLLRATRYRASLPLQVAAGAELIEDQGLRDHALANFLRRFHRGTLSDPAG